jgi:hypothetical protein
MSFAPFLHKVASYADPVSRLDKGKLDLGYDVFGPKAVPPTPGVPNANDAANAAQQSTDALRARRGMLANIYAGAGNQAPVTGKTALGT